MPDGQTMTGHQLIRGRIDKIATLKKRCLGVGHYCDNRNNCSRYHGRDTFVATSYISTSWSWLVIELFLKLCVDMPGLGTRTSKPGLGGLYASTLPPGDNMMYFRCCWPYSFGVDTRVERISVLIHYSSKFDSSAKIMWKTSLMLQWGLLWSECYCCTCNNTRSLSGANFPSSNH